MQMHMEPVNSTNVHSIGYDPASETLRVHYHSGHTGDYSGVPQNKHDELMASDSKGQFLHKHVKPHHAHSRVD